MKVTTIPTTRKALPIPTVSAFRQNLEKIVDLLLSAAICVGIAAVLMFLLVLM